MISRKHPYRDIVVDASALLAAYLPDEGTPQAHRLMEDYALGRVTLWAPRLLILELLNACLVAKRRQRINERVLDDLAGLIAILDIKWVDVEGNAGQLFSLSKAFNLTAYDAAYIIAAQMKGCRLITGDSKMYESVKGSLPFVTSLKNYGEIWGDIEGYTNHHSPL